MGIDLSANLNYGTAVGELQQRQSVHRERRAAGRRQPLVGSSATTPSVKATLRAMESAGVVRTLAEPNLTAISGESATFIAGGEFPIPTGVTCQPRPRRRCRQCATSIAFKKFGISLNFTPVVLTEGRISLQVMTEVSEVSNDNSIKHRAAITQSRRSRPAAPKPRWRFRPAARWRWPA